MWPTSAAFDAALAASSRRWRNKIEITFAGEVVTVLDAVIGGQVSFDDVAVRRHLSVTLVDESGLLTPTDARDLLAPRGTECRVSRGLVLPSGEIEYIPLGVFGITDPQVNAHHGDATDGGTILSFSGFDRVDTIRKRRFVDAWRVASGTPTHTAITDIVTSRLPDVPLRVTQTGHTTPELTFDALSDPWDAVRSIASADGLTAFFDPLGTFVVGPNATVRTGVTYSPGPGSFLLSSNRAMSAENSYSGVVVRVEHPDTDPIVSVGWDLDPDSPTYADGPFGRRPYGFSSPVITTQAQADAARDTLLKRVVHMSQSAELSFVGHIGHEVGDLVEIADPQLRTSGEWMVTGGRVELRASQSANVLRLEREGQ